MNFVDALVSDTTILMSGDRAKCGDHPKAAFCTRAKCRFQVVTKKMVTFKQSLSSGTHH